MPRRYTDAEIRQLFANNRDRFVEVAQKFNANKAFNRIGEHNINAYWYWNYDGMWHDANNSSNVYKDIDALLKHIGVDRVDYEMFKKFMDDCNIDVLMRDKQLHDSIVMSTKSIDSPFAIVDTERLAIINSKIISTLLCADTLIAIDKHKEPIAYSMLEENWYIVREK